MRPDPTSSSGKKIALVTGATGAIGPSLVNMLLQKGYRVRVLARNGVPEGLLPSNVNTAIGDITDTIAVNRAARGCHIIFHLAAKLHISDPDPSLRAEYEAVNIMGTRNIVDAAMEANVERLVFFSTISVYGPGDGMRIYDESSLPKPQTFYSETKLAAEGIALAAQRPSGQNLAVVLRLAAVYGPRMKGNYQRLVTALRRGLFVHVGPGDNRRTLVYVEDVARAALIVGEAERFPSRVYNVTDGEIHTFAQIIDAMAAALGRQPPRLQLPILPVRWLLRLGDFGFSLFGQKAPVSEATLEKLLEDVAVSGDRIGKEVGYEPQVTLRAGWKKTVQKTIEG